MPSTTNKVGFITDRDRKIFHFLFENKVATFEQIHRALFSDVSIHTNYRHLLKLVGSGWIQKAGICHEGKLKYIYSLQEKTYKTYVLEENMNDREFQLGSEVPAHDLTIVDIRNHLEKIETVQRFYTENALQSSYELAETEELKDLIGIRPDAAIDVLLQEKYRFVIPLEYEASIKSKMRSQKKVLDYYIRYDGNAVLFICKDDAILRALVKVDQEISREFDPKLYFALLANVIDAAGELIFTSSNGEKRIRL